MSLSQPGVLRAVVGGGLMIDVLGRFALGLATILRHTAGAITAFVGTLPVLPLVVRALPSSIGHPISKYLPLNISDTMPLEGREDLRSYLTVVLAGQYTQVNA